MSNLIAKPKRVETIHTTDISNIDWSLYPRSNKLKISFCISDLAVQVFLYPHGYSKSPKPNFCAIFYNVIDAKEDDDRFISVSVKVGLQNFPNYTTSAAKVSHHFSSFGTGSSSAFKSSFLKNSEILEITAVLYEDTGYIIPTKVVKESFTKQLQRMNYFSTRTGDVTMVVKVNGGEDENCALYAPPSKKQKRNVNANNDGEIEVELKMSSIILKAASPVLNKMLSSRMIEQQQKRVTVIAKSVKDVKDLLYFMSTDVLRDDCNAINMMELAQFYQMERLIWKCINRLIQNVSVENFVETIKIFDRFDIDEGYQTLVEFAKENVADLKKQQNYLMLPHSFRCGILGHFGEGSKRTK